MNEKDNKKIATDFKKKELDFITCPKHGVQYPKGSSCPVCKSGK